MEIRRAEGHLWVAATEIFRGVGEILEDPHVRDRWAGIEISVVRAPARG